jgi:hypothetical protein
VAILRRPPPQLRPPWRLAPPRQASSWMRSSSSRDPLSTIALDHAAVLLEPAAIVYAVTPPVVPPTSQLVEGTVQRGTWRGIDGGAT